MTFFYIVILRSRVNKFSVEKFIFKKNLFSILFFKDMSSVSVIISKGTALLSALSAGGAGPDVDGLVDHLFEVVVVVGLENINTENMDQKILEEWVENSVCSYVGLFSTSSTFQLFQNLC